MTGKEFQALATLICVEKANFTPIYRTGNITQHLVLLDLHPCNLDVLSQSIIQLENLRESQFYRYLIGSILSDLN